MILLVQPRANFHASIMPTCLHLLLFATPATLRGSWKRRKTMLISLLHELLPVSRLHSEVFISGFSKTKKKGYKCPKNIRKHQSSSKFNNCQSSALEQSASISNRSDRSKLQSGGTVRSQPRMVYSRCFHPSCQEDPMKSTFRAKGRMYSRCSWQRRKRRKAKVIPTRYSKEFFVGKTCL